MDEEARRPLLQSDRDLIQSEEQQDGTSNEPRPWSARLHQVRSSVQNYLTSSMGHYSVLLLVSLDVSCIFADLLINLVQCEQRHPDKGLGTARDVLGSVGLVFSCLFMVELLASVWAFGFQYFQSRFHCFDAFVIVLGFIVDVVLHGTLEEVASLVVVGRLWRVFKIIEEFSAGAADQMDALHEEIERLERENKSLRQEMHELKKAPAAAEEEEEEEEGEGER